MQNQCDHLFSVLNVDGASLTEGQHRALETLLLEFVDAFALDSSELGSIDVVTHFVETANHPPIRQPARWTPFAFRPHINEDA